MRPLNIIQAYNQSKLFKGKKRIINIGLQFVDISLTLIVFYLSYYLIKELHYPTLTFNWQYFAFAILLVPVSIVFLHTSNLARIPRTSRYLSVFFDFVRYSIALAITMLLFKLVFRLNTIPGDVFSTFILLNLLVLTGMRIFTFSIFKELRASGHNMNNVVIIADDNSAHVIDKIMSRKEWGFNVLMILSDSINIRRKYGSSVKVIPNKVNVATIIDKDIVDEVVYAKGVVNKEEVQQLVNVCKEVGVVFRLQNDLSPLAYPKGNLVPVEDMAFLTYMNSPSNQIAMAWKTITEALFSFIMLFFLSPLMVLIALAIRIDSKGPAVFKQKRVGLRGRQFYIYKFRTMVTNAEELKAKLMAQNEMDGPTFKLKSDPRITRLGRFLRKTSLDELPQLVNVIKGEMSLIGPRPPLPSEVEQYERWQLRRLSVKPGITCTWQIIPNRNDVVFEKWMKMDMQYIDSWSLKNDVKLLFKTIKSVIVNHGY